MRQDTRTLQICSSVDGFAIHAAKIGPCFIIAQRINPGHLSWMLKIHSKAGRFVAFTSDVGGECWLIPRIEGDLHGHHKIVRVGWLWAALSVHYGKKADG